MTYYTATGSFSTNTNNILLFISTNYPWLKNDFTLLQFIIYVKFYANHMVGWSVTNNWFQWVQVTASHVFHCNRKSLNKTVSIQIIIEDQNHQLNNKWRASIFVSHVWLLHTTVISINIWNCRARVRFVFQNRAKKKKKKAKTNKRQMH